MNEVLKRTAVRASKLVHYLLTIFLFWECCRLFYNDILLENAVTLRNETMIFLYGLILLFALRTYSSYQVGIARVRMLVYSQTLGDLVAAGLMYVLLVVNRWDFINPLPFVIGIGAQFVLNCLWSYLVNALYFRLYQPRSSIIVYRDTADLSRLQEIEQHPRKFRVDKTYHFSSGEEMFPLEELAGFDAVFVAGVSATQRNGIVKYCVENNVRCYVVPHVGDVIMMGAKPSELFSVPVFRITRASLKIEYAAVKRAMDVIISGLALVVLSPVMLITAAAVKLYDGGPALYKQIRLTKDGREFEILKFRSMGVNAEKDGVARLASEHDDRITPVGRVIRACRIDELPQLINILRGDMSIVGPRPERPEIARQYEEMMPAFNLRLQVKAGLTGLAQVFGRYNTDPYDKLRMDLMYINQMSLLQDIKLMFATVKILFMKESTSGVAQGQTTAAAEREEEKV